MSLRIAKPTNSFCSLLRTNNYQIKYDELFTARLDRAAHLAIKVNEKNMPKIDQALKEAIRMKGRDNTYNYLFYLNSIEVINTKIFNLLVTRLNYTVWILEPRQPRSGFIDALFK